jgi:glyceraldehyde 3-phosphate dehydrogenase
MGTLPEEVLVDGDSLVVAGRPIKVFSGRMPGELPWGELGVDVVVESTGKFTARADAAGHLAAGANRVVVSAPAADADATIVMGVNDDTYDPERHKVVSNASCTTNCFVPMVKVLDDSFGVVSGLMTTVHAYTNDQNLVDFPHRDLRRARAAAINIVPAATGAARATGLVLQAMQGRLDGHALRVPVPTGSITDFTAVVHGAPSVAVVNEAFATAADGTLKGILVYTEAPFVSTDVLGSPASCTFDSGLTLVQGIGADTSLVKVFGWYDNEWGYSNRLVDVVRLVGRH